MKEIKIIEKYDGLLLKKYLSEVLGYSRRQITRLYTSKFIFINNENINLTYVLKTGDLLKIEETSFLNLKSIKTTGKPIILYEDKYLIIINKPAGICAHPSKEHQDDDMETLLETYLNKKVYPVGRLDKNVSGVMLYALSKESASKLNKLRQDNKLNKYYECLIKGHFKLKEGRLIYYLAKDEKSHKFISDKNGLRCITDYWTIQEEKDISHLRIHILTGRSHQIRAGLALNNHPIIGDFMYGQKDNRLNRVALHASSLEFIHPFTYEEIKIECHLPNEIKRYLERI